MIQASQNVLRLDVKCYFPVCFFFFFTSDIFTIQETNARTICLLIFELAEDEEKKKEQERKVFGFWIYFLFYLFCLSHKLNNTPTHTSNISRGKMSSTPITVPDDLTGSLSGLGYTLSIGHDDVKGRTVVLTNKSTSSSKTNNNTISPGTLLLKEPAILTVASSENHNMGACAYCLQTHGSLSRHKAVFQDSREIAPLKKCSSCKLSYYCSPQASEPSCQERDWKETHKIECALLKRWLEAYPSEAKSNHRAPATVVRAVLKVLSQREKRKELDELFNVLDGCEYLDYYYYLVIFVMKKIVGH